VTIAVAAALRQNAAGTVRVGLWECTPGRFWTRFEAGEGEFIRLVAGRLTCVEDAGPTTRLGPGDAITFPPGWTGEWRIEGTLRKVFAGWTPGGPDPQEEEWRRFLAFHAVADQLQSRAARKGLLVVLEDLHWAGTPAQLLLLLLRYVAAHLGRLGSVLLLGTCREAELEPSAPVARLVNGAEQLAWVALTPPRLATSSPTSPTSGSVHRLRRVFSGPPVASLLRHAARSSGHRPCCPAPGPDHPSRD
jgi:uncharacterized cupin superfamily protein